MLKKNIPVILTLLVASLGLTAQITLTNATFPVAGDSLKTATDLTPTGIVMTSPGGPQTWDFSSLNPDTRQVNFFQLAAAGTSSANFPGAELVVLGDVGVETYYDVTAATFSLLGISGAGLSAGFPVQADLIYNPPLVINEAPLNFFDVDNYTSNATIALPTSAIPGAIFDSLGIPTGTFDSIRLRITVQSIRLVDGYGTLAIPGGTYDVLRQKQTDYTTTGVDVHTFLGWIDVAALLGGVPLFPNDTSITFNFLSNTAKEPIAVVTVDSTQQIAVQVDYKDNGIESAVNPVPGETTAIVVYPNPATDQVTFDIKYNLPGNYSFRLYDVNGQRVLDKEPASHLEEVSIQSLSPGLYIIQVIYENDQVVGYGKLMKQ
jgi:hypothetical protein